MATKTMTIKQAKALAAELVEGTAVKTKVTDAVSSLYYRHINNNRLGADTVMIELWCGCAVDKASLAVIRSIFNRVTKRIHKELNIDKRAMCVKDGKLEEVQLRGASKGTGTGGGEGEGDSNAESTGASVMAPNGKALSPVEALAEALFQVSAYAEELAKIEQDGELSQSIIDVDIALCQIKEKLLEALEPLDKAA
tara:strand:- start:264 stop:851 length:588 start_codon:yes stop_codon:yes gene_type:complete